MSDVVGIVPILRAGLGMAEGIIELLPEAEVWHIGLFRDEATLRPMEYYNKFPDCTRVTVALLVDPMLATGGSAARACEIIKAAGVPRLKLISLIAAPEGILLVNRSMPDVPIHVGAVDERLNDQVSFFPGLVTPATVSSGPVRLRKASKNDRASNLPAVIGGRLSTTAKRIHASCRHHSEESRWGGTHSGGDRGDGLGQRGG